MKLLVIPDVHLKPYIYEKASVLMKKKKLDKAVMLGDIADDFGKEDAWQEYEKTYEAAIAFVKEYPETLFCYGNHDVSYLWNRSESGFSENGKTRAVIYTKFQEFVDSFPDSNQVGVVHRIDKVLFSHGGISQYFIEEHFSRVKSNNVDHVVKTINEMFNLIPYRSVLWHDDSPLWLRPQYGFARTYMPERYLQVVGHTPVESVKSERNILSCDLFSTDRTGEPYGTREFVILDTLTWDYTTICIDDI